MFCPVCWKNYPKGFATCEVCKAPLSEGEAEGHKHEHDKKPMEEQAKSTEGKTPKK